LVKVQLRLQPRRLAAVLATVVTVVITTVIAVFLAVPAVVVFNPIAVPTPVPDEELLAVVTRLDPACAFVWRSSPVTVMPPVALARRIPVAADPNEVGAWPGRLHPEHSRSRWRTNSESNRDLSSDDRPKGQ
jgi:hypothetical protein